MAPPSPPRGVYAPVVAFFHEDETLDLDALKQHITRLIKGGVAGLVIQGSNGEAPHLLHDERKSVIAVAAALRKELNPALVIIAGCGAPSTRETIQLCREAHESGADYALVLSPSYWAKAMNTTILTKFFTDVATEAPLPILLYNFPAVTGGIDLDSDLIASLAAAHPGRIVGCKLTCGNLGKLQRVAHDPRLEGKPMAVFAGKSDFFLHGLVGGSTGVIAAAANLVPKVHVQLLKYYDAGDLVSAQKLQTLLSRADWVLVQLGVAGLKAALDRYYGYGGGRSRRPLGLVASSKFDGGADETLKAVLDVEKSL